MSYDALHRLGTNALICKLKVHDCSNSNANGANFYVLLEAEFSIPFLIYFVDICYSNCFLYLLLDQKQ